MSTTATLSGTFTFDSLAPDQVLEASFNYKPDDGTTGKNTGLNAIPANDNGIWTISLVLSFLIGAKHTPGVLTYWLREPGTTQTADAVLDQGGNPCKGTLRIP